MRCPELWGLCSFQEILLSDSSEYDSYIHLLTERIFSLLAFFLKRKGNSIILLSKLLLFSLIHTNFFAYFRSQLKVDFLRRTPWTPELVGSCFNVPLLRSIITLIILYDCYVFSNMFPPLDLHEIIDTNKWLVFNAIELNNLNFHNKPCLRIVDI